LSKLVRNYWIAKHDRGSIEDRPGWIWRSKRSGNARLPPNFGQIKKDDYFALISYPYYEDDKPIHQVYGIYRVTSEWEFVQKASPSSDYEYPGAFVIRGKLLKGLQERFVTVPNIASYYRKEYTGKAVIGARSEKIFFDLLNIFKKYSSRNIDFFPLIGEPTSEQGVVALFAKNLRKLGYKRIESIGTRFPDACVINAEGKPEYVEFEYYASNYDHELRYEEKPVTCVCWIDDRPKTRAKKLPKVIEMREKL